MSTIKNGQISNHKIKRGTSFQSLALNQEHVRNVCYTAHYYLTKFRFDIPRIQKK